MPRRSKSEWLKNAREHTCKEPTFGEFVLQCLGLKKIRTECSPLTPPLNLGIEARAPLPRETLERIAQERNGG